LSAQRSVAILAYFAAAALLDERAMNDLISLELRALIMIRSLDWQIAFGA
jgi:hypothetical protein